MSVNYYELRGDGEPDYRITPLEAKELALSLRIACYDGTIGQGLKSVGRKVHYRDTETQAAIRSIAIFDQQYGLTIKQGLGLEPVVTLA